MIVPLALQAIRSCGIAGACVKPPIKLLFLCSIVILIMGCEASSAESRTDQNAQGVSSWCGNSNMVKFGLKGPENIKFSIPEAYLFDPYNTYYKSTKSKDPIDFISILLSKKNGEPNCLGKETDAYTSVSIRSGYDKIGFGKILDSLKIGQSYDLGNENDQFHVFRNTQGIEGLTRDILVPTSSPYNETLYLKCSYGMAMIDRNNPDYSEQRTGCHVYSRSNNNILIEYVIRAEDLKDYQKIDTNIHKIINQYILR